MYDDTVYAKEDNKKKPLIYVNYSCDVFSS